MLKVLGLIFLTEILNVIGQIFFKKGVNTVEERDLRGAGTYIAFFKDALKRPPIWYGLGSMVLSIAVWLMALAQADLSFVFPVGSMQYILILITAHMFLDEKIDVMKLTGTLLVVLGIVVITMS